MRVLTRLLVYAVVVLAAAGCGERAAQEPSSGGEPPDPRPRLLTWKGPTDGTMQALVTGSLRVNDRGCFTVAGAVIIAPPGSRVVPGGDAVRIRGVGRVGVGGEVRGAGGYIDAADARPSVARRDCLREGSEAGYAVIGGPA